MKKKTYKIIICVCLFMLLFTNFIHIFAAINEQYLPQKEVSENALDAKVKAPVLLDALANMINALASLAEYLIGTIFYDLTGDNVFPWADRIVFNGIGFLDINFLNPADNSLFNAHGTETVLGKAVRSVYSTVFSLAVLFLGVAVGVMAIRLAISSIASEKAKYKKAIVNWATCIVMLFMMHYILSFVFWVNEKMVEIASGILTKTIADTGITTVDFKDALNSVLSPEERINNYLSITGGSWFGQVAGAETTLKYDPNITNDFLTNEEYYKNRMVYIADKGDKWYSDVASFFAGDSENNKIGLYRLMADIDDARNIKANLSKAKADMKKNGYYKAARSNIWRDVDRYKASSDFEDDLRDYLYYLKSSESFTLKPTLLQKFVDEPQKKIKVTNNPNMLSSAAGYIVSALTFGQYAKWKNINNEDEAYGKTIDEVKDILGAKGISTVIKYRMQCDKYIWNVANGGTAEGSSRDIIASLGYFFKKAAFIYDTDDSGEVVGWRASKVSVVGALIYGIFIVQSTMYLFTYLRRLFYVMMLAMFGPIVVVYDFFSKSVSG